MAAKQLPPRPNLDQLKRQAKELLQAGKAVALHEAQTVIAREYGFASWNKLRDHVEAVTLEFDAAVDAFLEAATDERRERAVALHPKIATANLHTALVLGDADAVETRLERDPSLATSPLWESCCWTPARRSSGRRGPSRRRESSRSWRRGGEAALNFARGQ